MSFAQGIEVYTVTGADIRATFLAGLVLAGLAAVVTWMVLSTPIVPDDPEETVESPAPRRRGRRRPHTGVRHESARTVDLSKVTGGGRRG